MVRGAGGGIYMLGRARVNVVNSCADQAYTRGRQPCRIRPARVLATTAAADFSDSTGTAQVCPCRVCRHHSEQRTQLVHVLRAAATHPIDYLEAFFGVDEEGFEFGGTAIDPTSDWNRRLRRAATTRSSAIPRPRAVHHHRPWTGYSPAGDQNGDKGPRATTTSTTTLRFSARAGPIKPSPTARSSEIAAPETRFFTRRSPRPRRHRQSIVQAIKLRHGHQRDGYGFDDKAFKVDVDETFAAALPDIRTLAQHSSTTRTGVDQSLASGNVFLVRGTRSFRSAINFNFWLPRAGSVSR